jgi:phosphohistidine phosphatase SixA
LKGSVVRVYLIRHGKAEPCAEGGLDADRPLAALGEQHAAYLAERIAGEAEPPRRVVCSDAVRAHRTAMPIAAALGVEPEIDVRLRVDERLSCAIDVVCERADEPICVVGHNPQLAQAIAAFLDGLGAPQVRLRTGEAWELELSGAPYIGTGRVLGRHRLDE